MTKVIWRPQAGPQKALVDCPYPEIFFGGARGGGKTDGVLGKWALKERRYGAGFNAIMFRRTTVSSEDAIDRSKQIFGPLGGKFNGSKLIWQMPNGGRVAFAYLDSISDADEYQGRNVTDAWVEEAGQYAAPDPIDRLFGVLRSAGGVPIQLILTANPGGAGQNWIRERYHLNPFPKTPQIVTRQLPNGATHDMAVIPSRITDNKILLSNDPEYLNRLHMVGGAELVKAWLHGDWTAIEGAFFSGWHDWERANGICKPFELTGEGTRFRSFDWGYARPFSVGWWFVPANDLPHPDGFIIPKNSLIRYREWYGVAKNPDGTTKTNTGLRLDVEDVAEGIKEREAGEVIDYGVADPAIFSQDGGPSMAERMLLRKVIWRPADNKRVGTLGHMGGWDQMRTRMKGEEGKPAMYFFDTCRDSIRTIPTLQHDEKRPEDLDSDGEDHAADEIRYAVMSRPYSPRIKETEPARFPQDLTFNEIRDRITRKRLNDE